MHFYAFTVFLDGRGLEEVGLQDDLLVVVGVDTAGLARGVPAVAAQPAEHLGTVLRRRRDLLRRPEIACRSFKTMWMLKRHSSHRAHRGYHGWPAFCVKTRKATFGNSY